VRYWAVIPAAGAGVRMQTDLPKQYLALRGRPVLDHTLERFCTHPKIEGVVVAIAGGDTCWAALPLATHPKVRKATGGEERCHSVLNCLHLLAGFADPGDWVLVHDAVRPCVSTEDIDRLMNALADHPVGGLLACPVRDTMKRADGDGRVEQTVCREGLWHALTPQMFHLGDLAAALDGAVARGVLVTDESQAMEMAGKRPLLVPGRSTNIKITSRDDLALAELYLKRTD